MNCTNVLCLSGLCGPGCVCLGAGVGAWSGAVEGNKARGMAYLFKDGFALPRDKVPRDLVGVQARVAGARGGVVVDNVTGARVRTVKEPPHDPSVPGMEVVEGHLVRGDLTIPGASMRRVMASAPGGCVLVIPMGMPSLRQRAWVKATRLVSAFGYSLHPVRPRDALMLTGGVAPAAGLVTLVNPRSQLREVGYTHVAYLSAPTWEGYAALARTMQDAKITLLVGPAPLDKPAGAASDALSSWGVTAYWSLPPAPPLRVE